MAADKRLLAILASEMHDARATYEEKQRTSTRTRADMEQIRIAALAYQQARARYLEVLADLDDNEKRAIGMVGKSHLKL